MYFENFIGEDFLEWREGQVIIINAPTGCGKSSFIEGRFKENALLTRKRILYCTNRIILKNQMIERQNRRIFSERMMQEAFFLNYKPREEGNFFIVTYQEIENAILYGNRRAIEFFSSFDIAIADECHYFISDAIFNPNTIVSFEFLMFYYRNRQLIFMSATMRNFYGILINYINRATRQTDRFVEGMFPAFRYYDIKTDYTGITFDYIMENKELIKKISSFPDQGKILIFVSSILEGKEVKGLLKKIIPSQDIFLLTSESVETEKGTSIRDELISEQRFSCRVLIATALVDTGINIVDEDVKYIFLFQNDEEEAIQMLGRRRRMSGEPLYVCLHGRSQLYFKRKYNQLRYEINYLNYVCKQEKYDREYFNIFIAKDFYQKEKAEVLKKFVGMNMQRNVFCRYFVNEFSCQRMYQLQEEYRTISNAFDEMDAGAFLFWQSKWFGLDQENIRSLTPQTYLEQISEYVQIYIDKEMKKEEFDQFRKALMPLLHQADRKKFPKKTELSKWQKLNDFFSENMLPFVIQMNPKANDAERTYVIQKAEMGLSYEQEK